MTKNPTSATFVRQANIAHGPQQVNNAPETIARAEAIEIPQSKLLEKGHGERLDFGTTSQTVGSDPALETMGAVNRAEDV